MEDTDKKLVKAKASAILNMLCGLNQKQTIRVLNVVFTVLEKSFDNNFEMPDAIVLQKK